MMDPRRGKVRNFGRGARWHPKKLLNCISSCCIKEADRYIKCLKVLIAKFKKAIRCVKNSVKKRIAGNMIAPNFFENVGEGHMYGLSILSKFSMTAFLLLSGTNIR